MRSRRFKYKCLLCLLSKLSVGRSEDFLCKISVSEIVCKFWEVTNLSQDLWKSLDSPQNVGNMRYVVYWFFFFSQIVTSLF